MCITMGQTDAKLSGTRIYVGEALKNDALVHVLAYQNRASSEPNVPNAMILPFPTQKPMGPENAFDTKGYKDFLDNITDATRHRRRSRSKTLGHDAVAMCAAGAQVFDVGSYTVILADHVKQVPEALKRVSEDKRPDVTIQFLIGFGNMYPGQPVALCCWAGGEVEAEPLLWWYEPTNPNYLFIPTMDAHDGGPPDVNAMVETDHIISVGSAHHPSGSPVMYRNEGGYVETELPAKVQSLLPSRVYGYRTPYRTKNGDTFVDVANLRIPHPSVMIKRGAKFDQTSSSHEMDGWG